MKLALLVGLLFAATSSAAAQNLSGSYSFKICRAPCSDSPNEIIASGTFVLYPDSASLNRAVEAAAVTFSSRSRFYGFYADQLNACFTALTHSRRIEGRELYIGIHPSGRTTWTVVDSQISVKLYQSPDASAHIIGRVVGDSIVGINRQRHCCGGGLMQVGYAVAVRLGPPKAEDCVARVEQDTDESA